MLLLLLLLLLLFYKKAMFSLRDVSTQGLCHFAAPSSEAVGNLEMSLELDAPKPKRNRSRISKKSGTAMMLPLHFHYEDVLRQDLLLKQNNANIMQVPGLYEIRLAPKAGSDLRVPIGKLAMEILSGQRFKEVQSDPFSKARKSARTNPFIGAGKDSGNAFARQSVLRGHAMYNFLVRIDSGVHVRFSCRNSGKHHKVLHGDGVL